MLLTKDGKALMLLCCLFRSIQHLLYGFDLSLLAVTLYLADVGVKYRVEA